MEIVKKAGLHMSALIHTELLSLRYGDRLIWYDINLIVESRQIVAVVGLNGSGKTSLFRILGGLQRPTNGSITGSAYVGRPSMPHSLFIPVDPFVYEHLTIQEMLMFYAGLTDASKNDALSLQARLGLDEYAQQKVSRVSFGTRAKLSICLAFLSPSNLLLIDELYNGLDPLAVQTVSELICERAATGTAILISSHSLELVQTIANRILILKDQTISEIMENDRDQLNLRQLLLSSDRAEDQLQ